ncbi:primosomal protein N' [Corynebacterium hansenii]|uniref:Probable replication restart protein PriA n=1 Tax=Corynebacterium hansenii TaxID=394964 RepID=A0ABV7ZTX6_9CORY|nr:primosomal protein N' [Corynebacterium hansenii]WJY99944.1 Primosomal protein N' [Corynebacterium hansenii]
MTTTRDTMADRPVARVLPLLGLPQLDRPFDYSVPESLSESARPGTRVRVRFSGKLVNGIILERAAAAEHDGALTPIKDVVSPEVVYPPQLAALVDSLAELYAGVRSDIIRSAVPSRHARAEKARGEGPGASWEELGRLELDDADVSAWDAYAFGGSFVSAVRSGAAARAAWHPAPGEDVPARLAELAVTVARDGGGVLIVVPDQRAVDALEAALRELISPRQITVLAAGLGPESRYRRYLDILHGSGRLVVGTRSAAYAPVRNLRLAVILDDGDDNLVDPRAPYIHARDVLVTRSAQEKCALILASATRTAEVELLVESGWAHGLVPTPETLAARMPAIIPSTDTEADPEDVSRGRLPAAAYRVAATSLRAGMPVLVQVPRKGYVPTLSCARCGAPARCRHCNGPLEIPHGPSQSGAAGPSGHHAHPGHGGEGAGEAAPPTCRWCGRVDVRHRCHECGGTRMRPVIVGSERTAEELGRTFRPHPVISSSGERILDEVAPGPRIVVATPGAEPRPPGGYGAALILDTWATMNRQDLRAQEEALATWARAVHLVRPEADGGHVVIDADAAVPVVGDLLRWDITGAAARELADRGAAGLPPATRMAAIDGTAEGVERFIADFEAPEGAEILGPVDLPPGGRPPAGIEPGTPIRRLLVRVERTRARELGRALRAARGVRATRRDPAPVRVIVDPARFG